jgi:predicted nucleic acid-binding protein
VIFLDTNVVSELIKLDADKGVLDWFAAQHPDETFICSITVLELFTGVESMARGRRRDDAEVRIRRILSLLGPVIVPFGDAAAEYCAAFIAADPNVDVFDAQIGSIALAHRAALATRNIRHFDAFGIELINPWD